MRRKLRQQTKVGLHLKTKGKLQITHRCPTIFSNLYTEVILTVPRLQFTRDVWRVNNCIVLYRFVPVVYGSSIMHIVAYRVICAFFLNTKLSAQLLVPQCLGALSPL